MKRSNGLAPAKKLLIISDHAGFSRDVIARWQMQPELPEFTALSSDLWHGAPSSAFDMALVGDVRPVRGTEILTELNRGQAPSLYVTAPGESVHVIRRDYPRVIVVPRHDAWLDTVVLLSEEVLKRAEIAAHIERIEQSARMHEMNAALGRYMVEMRHSFNNALTSVLGNAELLLLERSALNTGMREQLETLHMMTLRMHEMMQRFTSLQSELQCTERSGNGEPANRPHSHAARA